MKMIVNIQCHLMDTKMLRCCVLILCLFLPEIVKCQRGSYAYGRVNVQDVNNRQGGNTRQPANLGRLREIYSWSQVDFQFPDARTREEAIRTGTFVPVNVSVPASVEAGNDLLFVAIPRWLSGTPATLNVVQYPPENRSPVLVPYPNLAFNRQGNCNGLTSVYRVKVDTCNRVWVMDTGKVDAFETPRQLCPYQVYVFDLNNRNELIYRYVLPTEVVRDDSLFVTIEVHYPRDSCLINEAFLYLADSDAFGLVVAQMGTGSAWRIRDKTMFPSPEAGTFNILSETFELMDGIFGLALSPDRRILFYNAMNEYNLRWVNTNIIQNQSIAAISPNEYHTAGRNSYMSQVGDIAIDSQGVLFFGLLNRQSVACWNTRVPFTNENVAILAVEDEQLQFPISVQVDNRDQLWIMSTRFQKFAVGTLPARDTNFRVFMGPTAELVRGTACETRQGMRGGPYVPSASQGQSSQTQRPPSQTQRPPTRAPGTGYGGIRGSGNSG